MPSNNFQDEMRLWDELTPKVDSNIRAQPSMEDLKSKQKFSVAATLVASDEDISVFTAAAALIALSQTHTQKEAPRIDHPKPISPNEGYDQALKVWATNDLTLAQQEIQAETLFQLFPFYKTREKKEERKIRNKVTKVKRKIGLSVKRELRILAAEERKETAGSKRAAAVAAEMTHEVNNPDTTDKKEGSASKPRRTTKAIPSTIKTIKSPITLTIKVEIPRENPEPVKREVKNENVSIRLTYKPRPSKRKAPAEEQEINQKRIRIRFKGMPAPAPISISAPETTIVVAATATADQPISVTTSAVISPATSNLPASNASMSHVGPSTLKNKKGIKSRNAQKQPPLKEDPNPTLRRSARIRTNNTKIRLLVGRDQKGPRRSEYL